MHFDRKSYGTRIRQLRISKGLTQEQLAEKISISRTYIVKIESGLQIGPIEIAIELAKFFNVSLDSVASRPIAKRRRSSQKHWAAARY